MIKITKDTESQVTFQKMTRGESWFDNRCSNENLLIQCERPGGLIRRVQFDDDVYIGDTLHVYFYTGKEAELLDIYRKGFNDALNKKEGPGFFGLSYVGEENNAYQNGRADAIAGDEVSSVDDQTYAEILTNIRKPEVSTTKNPRNWVEDYHFEMGTT